MGTRNLTTVKIGGQTKIAQYGQWDGYPSGQGKTCLEFLQTADLDKFKNQLNKVKFTDEEYDKEVEAFLKSIGSENGWVTSEQSKLFNEKYPFFTRDHGAGILELVCNTDIEDIRLHDSSDFIEDGVFCEWAYTIDFDKNTFEVYQGGNNLVKTYDLNDLPTLEAFYADLNEDDD